MLLEVAVDAGVEHNVCGVVKMLVPKVVGLPQSQLVNWFFYLNYKFVSISSIFFLIAYFLQCYLSKPLTSLSYSLNAIIP
jgi:hypothetical protein